MSFIRLHSPITFPSTILGNSNIQPLGDGYPNQSTAAVDATAEKLAIIGYVHWYGAPTSAKTMDSSSKIHFKTGSAVTFADAGTNLRIGLQDVLATGVTLVQPDGTFDVYADVAGNSGTITSSDDLVNKTITMVTGTKSVAHGDLVAVVFDMTARGGSDSFTLGGISGNTNSAIPASIGYTTSWGKASAGRACASVMLEASDGTLGVIYGIPYVGTVAIYSYQASTNPDERGLIFQVPFRCKVNGAIAVLSSNNTAADLEFHLYSTPLGTPTEMVAVAWPGDYGNADNDERPAACMFAEQTLEANTDYCLSVEATGTAVINLYYVNLASADHRAVQGLANCRYGYRDGGTGAFTETTTIYPGIALLISAIDDGTGMGNASMNIGGIC